MAKLYFRYSVMNAGKSTQLLQIAYDYEKHNNRKIVCTKPSIDSKGERYIVSRMQNSEIKRECDFLITDKTRGWLYSYIQKMNESNEDRISIILIDEAQFLSKENVWDLVDIVVKQKIPVICFGLKVDAFGEPFEGSNYLFALAQDIEEVTTRAICRLSEKPRKATMNLRLVNGKPVFSGEQVAIENSVDIKYMPVSLNVYVNLKDQ